MESTFNKDHLQVASHEAPIVKKKKNLKKKAGHSKIKKKLIENALDKFFGMVK